MRGAERVAGVCAETVLKAADFLEIGWLGFDHFIIAKHDPLVEARNSMLRDSKPGEDRLEVFRTALAARGLKIVEDK